MKRNGRKSELAHAMMSEYLRRYPERRSDLDVSYFSALPEEERNSIIQAANAKVEAA